MPENEENTDRWDCPLGIENRQRIRTLEGNESRMINVVDRLRDRLPIWAVCLLMFYSAALAACITIVVTHLLTKG